MLYFKKPKIFQPIYEAAGCFVQYKNEFVLLLRNEDKPQGNTWGLPSGKVNLNENKKQAVIREVYEEIGIDISKNLIFFKTVFVSLPKNDYVYHLFSSNLNKKPEIRLNPAEHKKAEWINASNALKLPLIKDLDECINLFFGQ